MAGLTPAEADQLAEVLNQICSATLTALEAGDPQQRLAVAASLRQFRAQFDASSEVGGFVEVLAEWLEGTRPDQAMAQQLNEPFRRALRTMLAEVPPPPTVAASDPPPISGRVLAQLIAAVVAAERAGDVTVQREMAANLVNTYNKLDERWQPRLGPLLENLRKVLGGMDARLLPPVPDPFYQNLWLSTVELLVHADLSEERARDQLLDRLVHNTLFTLRSADEELTEGFLRALTDVQREALASNAPDIATLVTAIRALLQGVDAAPFAMLLKGEERAAWERILAGE